MILVGPRAPELRDIRAAFSTLPKAFGLVWNAHRAGTIAMAVVTLLAAILPVVQAWVGKLIVDAVILSIGNGLPPQAALQAALPYLLMEFGLITVGAANAEARSVLQRTVSAHLRYSMSTAIMRQALGLDLSYFENAAFYDKLQNARQETEVRAITLLDTTFTLIQHTISLVVTMVILVAASPLVALILAVAALPAFLVQMRYSEMYYHMRSMSAPEFRRMNYLEHLLTVDTSMKEVKLFGLGSSLLKQYEKLFWTFYKADIALIRQRGTRSFFWGLVASGSYYAAYAWIVWRTVSRLITLGDLTFYLTLFRQAQTTVQALFGTMGQIYESSLFMDNLFSFLDLKPLMTNTANARKVPHPIQHGIEFRNVSFRYPNREDWALRDINLVIAPGEKLALVGANGAGKTTFVKLLTRLYAPTEGQILLDGVDLSEYDIEDLHKRIGVIFQDFVRYHATAGENIGYGAIEAMHEQSRIAGAAERGGADEVISALPQGYATMLGHWFDRGFELSGGQWQKIALSRAFMRDGEVLVLDEPTSALDAEREYEIFQRFRELTTGKIALLISHRFSTVRMADHIVVIEGGQLKEYGTHDQLLALDGIYARLFDMQAAGYR